MVFVIIAGSSNGRTSGFGPEYLGSSPSPAAIDLSQRTYLCQIT